MMSCTLLSPAHLADAEACLVICLLLIAARHLVKCVQAMRDGNDVDDAARGVRRIELPDGTLRIEEQREERR